MTNNSNRSNSGTDNFGNLQFWNHSSAGDSCGFWLYHQEEKGKIEENQRDGGPAELQLHRI